MTASPYLTADDIAVIFHMTRRYVVEQTPRWNAAVNAGFKSGGVWLYRPSDVPLIEKYLSDETKRSTGRRPKATPEPAVKTRASKTKQPPPIFAGSNVSPLVAKPRPARSA
jgi:hypothetical protein